jgi:hypothetical protein
MKKRLQAWLRRQEATENQLVWLERIMIVSALSTTLCVGLILGLRIGYMELFAPYNVVEIGMPAGFADHWRVWNAAALLSVVCLAMSGISVWTSELVSE